MMNTKLKGGILGVAIGDALGVPVEFKSREYLKAHPVQDFMGYMSWNQPPGTWSDDSAMMFCLMDSLLQGYDIEHIGQNFVQWYTTGFWGAHHEVFDIGGSTKHSLDRIIKGESAKFSGNLFEHDNGNGSLMRTLPLVFLLANEASIHRRYEIIKEVSAITHAHFRSVFSCFIYVEYGILLWQGMDKFDAYKAIQEPITHFASQMDFNPKELALFDRILTGTIAQEQEDTIMSSGYVLHSLEAAFWCFLTSDTYAETVLKAVNLGQDTDTTAAIAGGLAGVYYGASGIPTSWISRLVRVADIEQLISAFQNTLA